LGSPLPLQVSGSPPANNVSNNIFTFPSHEFVASNPIQIRSVSYSSGVAKQTKYQSEVFPDSCSSDDLSSGSPGSDGSDQCLNSLRRLPVFNNITH
jgi:hypothetical protein